jgi:hypothetical protein
MDGIYSGDYMNIIDFLKKETSGQVPNADRGYNGMSTIGDSCGRKLQYNMYLASGEGSIDRRISRLFNVGHAFEDTIIDILNDLDIQVYGRQDSYRDQHEMWFGHSDGFLTHEGKSYLLEMKTHNDKSFKALQKSGVKTSKSTHYDQMQMYMGYGEYEQGIYIAYNKNDSDLYFELVKFDEKRFNDLKIKSEAIIASDVLLPRIGNNSASWFECKFCDHINVCFNRELPDKNCRTCHWAEVTAGNKWACTYGRTEIGDLPLKFEEQKAGCDNHLYSGMFNEA